jgi:hypothetical protein
LIHLPHPRTLLLKQRRPMTCCTRHS